MRLLAEAPCEQVIDVLGDVAPAAIAAADERGKLVYPLGRLGIRADEGAEELQSALGLPATPPARASADILASPA